VSHLTRESYQKKFCAIDKISFVSHYASVFCDIHHPTLVSSRPTSMLLVFYILAFVRTTVFTNEIEVQSLHPTQLHKYNADAEEHKFFDCGGADCTTPDISVLPLQKFVIQLKFHSQGRSEPPNKWCQLPQPCNFCKKLFDDGRINLTGTSERLDGNTWLLVCCNNRAVHRQCLQFKRKF
jgi:hypothetical protein